MPEFDTANLWPYSAAAAIAASIMLLFLVRQQAQRFIFALSRVLHRLLRLAARAAANAEQRVTERNRLVLLAVAEDMRQRAIEREAQRVNQAVLRDLSAYPALHRELKDQIGRVDEDYRRSAEVPPMPPAWLDAIAAVAQIPANNDPAIARILEDMHGTLESAGNLALTEYRAGNRRRHRSLRRMLPYWRRLNGSLDKVDRTVSNLAERGDSIDRQLAAYRALREQPDRALRGLTVASITQFITAGLILAVAALAAVFNYQLLAPGMATIMPGTVGEFSGGDLAAGFVTLLQIGMGLVILESLRVTRLLPLISGLDEAMRTWLLVMAGGLLLALTVMEAGLAYSTATAASAILAPTAGPGWAAEAGLVIMGIVLPLVLAFVAVPLETFITAARSVGGLILAAALGLLAFALRLTGGVLQDIGVLIVRIYDVAIFLPLWLEGRWNGYRRDSPPTTAGAGTGTQAATEQEPEATDGPKPPPRTGRSAASRRAASTSTA